jgi:hypothetical protein
MLALKSPRWGVAQRRKPCVYATDISSGIFMKRTLAIAAVLLAASAQAAPFPSAVADRTAPVPHYQKLKLMLQPGGNSGQIHIPVMNEPVHMMVTTPTFGDRGVGEVTITHVGPNNPFLTWVGIDVATNGGGTPAVSASGGPAPNNTHIIYADTGKFIDVQTAPGNTIRVRSAESKPMDVVITFMW